MELLIKISFQNSLWCRVHQFCYPVIFSPGLYFFIFFFISTSIVLQSDESSSVAFFRGTVAGALLLTVKRTSYLLVTTFPLMLYVRCLLSLCVSMYSGSLQAVRMHFTRMPQGQILPFWKKNSLACFPCRWFAIMFEHIRAWYYSIMHACYTVNYATTATEKAV